MEPQTCAHQVLSQIASLVGIDLSARIIEELVFNKGAELRIPIVICACDDLLRQVRVIFPATGAKGAVGTLELRTCGFRIVNAHPRAGIRLESRFAGDDERSTPDVSIS